MAATQNPSRKTSERLANVARRDECIRTEFETELQKLTTGSIWARRNIAIATVAARYFLSEGTVGNILKRAAPATPMPAPTSN